MTPELETAKAELAATNRRIDRKLARLGRLLEREIARQEAIASETRADCLSAEKRCHSPIACDAFGYCRVRNWQ